MKKGKEKILFLVLLLLLLIGIRGTIAWLTSTDSIVNEFTVGEITSPTTDPEDSTKTIHINGNLYEKEWDESQAHKIVPGVSFTKKPYVGIGEGSEESVVYIYVENDFSASNKVYFTLNSGWQAVTGHAVEGPSTGTYASGLFKYTETLNASGGDAWTTAIFNSINVASNATTEELTPVGSTSNITVKSLVHQAKDASGTAIPAATIETAAINTLEN